MKKVLPIDLSDEIKILIVFFSIPACAVYGIGILFLNELLTINPFKMKKLLYAFFACVIQIGVTISELFIYSKSIYYFPEVNHYLLATAFSIIWVTAFVVLLGICFKNTKS